MKILLAEDDFDLATGIRVALQTQGMEVVWVRRIEEALRVLDTEGCDLILLDLGLPDGDGLSVLEQLRRDGARLPVLILSARDGLDDRLKGLDTGADDYMVKPFVLAELLSRVRALARRSYGGDGATFEVRGLWLHEPTQRVRVREMPVSLSRSEFKLLCLLVKRADRVVARRALEQLVLPNGQSQNSNVLDVHISNLRRKIGEGYIRTVRGIGYVIYQTAHTPPEAA
ncbi:response regulator transcription factor [Variovorax sp. EL159]|uniref:response regulator n=1 Tax=unclassified Variovorax TaxID=663243 RepID=UPI0008844515|nr:response regulator transcription factor [Variovorax sp. EL159]SCX74215.1 two-component system, OmpR family, response regulator BasR [Variovorax sp. EL159]